MAKQTPEYRLRVPHEVAALLRGLHPSLKHKIKTALQHMQIDPHCGKKLREELEGLRSCRVSRFRIAYRIADKRIVEIVAVGPRRTIYEETFRLLQRERR